jgi:hypothetical protein
MSGAIAAPVSADGRSGHDGWHAFRARRQPSSSETSRGMKRDGAVVRKTSALELRDGSARSRGRGLSIRPTDCLSLNQARVTNLAAPGGGGNFSLPRQQRSRSRSVALRHLGAGFVSAVIGVRDAAACARRPAAPSARNATARGAPAASARLAPGAATASTRLGAAPGAATGAGACARALTASGGHARGRRGDVVLVGAAPEPCSRECDNETEDKTVHLGNAPRGWFTRASDHSRGDR